MPFKKHTPEEIIGKLREAEIVLAQGGTTADGRIPDAGLGNPHQLRGRGNSSGQRGYNA